MKAGRFILLLIIICHHLYAKPIAIKRLSNNKDWNFVENEGQLSSSDIKYFGKQGLVYLFCRPGMISFVFTKIEKGTEKISEATSCGKQQTNNIAASRVDLLLIGSNLACQILASERQEYYENYYTKNTPETGVINVHSYKTITYKSIYPHIDLILYSREEGMKYKFIVYPGGRVSDIQLQWNGLQNLQLTKNGGISYASTLGFMQETKPISFQGQKKIESRFSKAENLISFKTAKYDKTQLLIIDPTLIWSTYFGGNAEDGGNSVATDKDGNVYMTGETSSISGIATNGAFQTLYTAGRDAFVTKFNNNGKILWATYYGDSCSVAQIALDDNGKVYITGSTIAKSNIATNGAFQTHYGGAVNGVQTGDAFLAKFNSEGFRQWSTYYGGSGEEYTIGTGVATDKNGNVYFTGETTNPTDIATNGAYQTDPPTNNSLSNGSAFIAKFNSTGARLWGTYYGYGTKQGEANAGPTTAYGIAIDLSGNLIIAGQTQSKTGIATSGAYKTSYSGQYPFEINNGFLAKFDSSGFLQWGTYYGDSFLTVSGVTTDSSGDIFITGETYDTTLATSGAYQTINFEQDAFLAKFSGKGSRLWATYYGGGGLSGAYANAIASDGFGNIYITGYTTSSNKIATSGAYQTLLIGGTDAFLAKFNSSGSLSWATYYGGNHGAIANGLCTDQSGNVYMIGTTSSDSGIATRRAYQTNYGGNDDAFLFRFGARNKDAGIDSFLSPNGNVMCKDTIPIIVNLYNYGSDDLDSVRIFLSLNAKVQPFYRWTGKLGTDSSIAVSLGVFGLLSANDTIKSWTSFPNGVQDSFAFNDTSTIIYKVLTPDANWTLNPLDSLSKTFTAIEGNYQQSDYTWGFGDGTNATGNPVTHIYKQSGKYKVSLNICNGEYDSSIWVINAVNVSVFPNPFGLQADIQYKLPNPTHVKITLYDMVGRYVTTLADANLVTGEYNTVFDATRLITRPGIYTVVFKSDDNVITKQIVQIDSIFY